MNEDENLGNLFYGMAFLSLDEIKSKRSEFENWEDELFTLKHADPQIDSKNIQNSDWIIFAHDSGRTGLYLDLAPTTLGKVGQIIFIDMEYEVGILVADSMTQLIENFLSDLEHGLYQLNEEALEDDNEFLECDESIDLINWHNSEKWARPSFEWF